MPVSKKRNTTGRSSHNETCDQTNENLNKNASFEELNEWTHTWHGVRVCSPPLSNNNKTFETKSEKFFNDSYFLLNQNSYKAQWLSLPRRSYFKSIKTIDNPRKTYKDFLYISLNMRWPMLILVLLAAFYGSVLLFAVLIVSCNDSELRHPYGINGKKHSLSRDFLDAFDLSFQTFCTIGYGALYPVSRCTNYIITIESMASMLIISILTGLVFAKFAKPLAKIAFSKVCVVQPYGNNRLALIIRVANATQSHNLRQDIIMEASFRVNVMRIENKKYLINNQIKSKKHLCRYQLRLVQSNFITFRMGLTLVHVIDEKSPFYGMNNDELSNSDMMLHVIMSGVDSTLRDTVTESYLYTPAHIRWGERFVEMLSYDELHSKVYMDFEKLSQTEDSPIYEEKYVFPAKIKLESKEKLKKEKIRRKYSIESRFEPILSDDEDSHNRKRKRKIHKTKSQFNMEPLFEPLLRHSIGTSMNNNLTVESDKKNPSFIVMEESNCKNDTSRQFKYLQDNLAGKLLKKESSGETDKTIETEDESYNNLESNQNKVISPGWNNKDLDYLSVSDDNNSSMNSFNDKQNIPRVFHIEPKNIPKSFSFSHFYHKALYLRWGPLSIIMISSFFVIHIIFSFIYYIKINNGFRMSSLLGNEISDFELCFFFSVQTLSTIGFGSMSPASGSIYSNFFVTLEGTLGIVLVTIITGISWSKFASPRAHIHFSKKIVITSLFGKRCLVFRAANARRHGEIYDCMFRIGVVLTNKKTGLRHVHDLSLVSGSWPSFSLSATLIHIIDQKSPFYSISNVQDLSITRMAVIVLFSGLDTTFSETVYARKTYFYDDFVFGKYFQDNMVLTPGGVVMNFKHFDTLLEKEEIQEQERNIYYKYGIYGQDPIISPFSTFTSEYPPISSSMLGGGDMLV